MEAEVVMQKPIIPESSVGLKANAINSVWFTTIYGCSLISPGMCIGGIIGYVAGMTGYTLVLAMLLAGIANYLWVVNYANLVQKFPKCGCHYTYVREGLNPALGFFLGWGRSSRLHFCMRRTCHRFWWIFAIFISQHPLSYYSRSLHVDDYSNLNTGY